MSLERDVFLAADRIPTVAAWQAALQQAGIDLILDLLTHDGFLPLTHEGRATGFELGLRVVDGAEAALADGRDRVAVFQWHGDFASAIAAVLAAAVLAALTDGVLYDVEAGVVVPTAEVLSAARAEAAEMAPFLDEDG